MTQTLFDEVFGNTTDTVEYTPPPRFEIDVVGRAEKQPAKEPKSFEDVFSDNPLLVPPKLAAVIGLHEAIVLSQIHYWLKKRQHRHDDRYWVYNSYPDWVSNFPFWTQEQVRRAIESLEKQELVLVGNYNTRSGDRTKWYSLNEQVLEEVVELIEDTLDTKAETLKQIRLRHNDLQVLRKGWVYLGDEIEDYIPPVPKW